VSNNGYLILKAGHIKAIIKPNIDIVGNENVKKYDKSGFLGEDKKKMKLNKSIEIISIN